MGKCLSLHGHLDEGITGNGPIPGVRQSLAEATLNAAEGSALMGLPEGVERAYHSVDSGAAFIPTVLVKHGFLEGQDLVQLVESIRRHVIVMINVGQLEGDVHVRDVERAPSRRSRRQLVEEHFELNGRRM